MDMLAQIKADAVADANTIELQWESFEIPSYREDFISVMERAKNLIPELEDLFTKLRNGDHITLPDTKTSLPYTDTERYTELIGGELYSAYVLKELYTRYQLVENILHTEYPNDRG